MEKEKKKVPEFEQTTQEQLMMKLFERQAINCEYFKEIRQFIDSQFAKITKKVFYS